MKATLGLPLLEELAAYQGNYLGEGRNSEGQEFRAEMKIAPRLDGLVIELSYRAFDNESGFHSELAWIAQDLMADRPALYNLSSNMPGVLQHRLVSDYETAGLNPENSLTQELIGRGVRRQLVFSLGEPHDLHTFRQQVTLELCVQQRVEYRYAWAVPHEEFLERNFARLKQT